MTQAELDALVARPPPARTRRVRRPLRRKAGGPTHVPTRTRKGRQRDGAKARTARRHARHAAEKGPDVHDHD